MSERKKQQDPLIFQRNLSSSFTWKPKATLSAGADEVGRAALRAYYSQASCSRISGIYSSTFLSFFINPFSSFPLIFALHAGCPQLDAVQPRFENDDKKLAITFSWTDTLAPKQPFIHDSSINFERANVLYNMAAVEVMCVECECLSEQVEV